MLSKINEAFLSIAITFDETLTAYTHTGSEYFPQKYRKNKKYLEIFFSLFG